MATSDGCKLEPIKETTNISRWLQRFEALMSYEAIDDAKKKDGLLSYIGHEAFDKIADAIVPDKPADKSYEDLVKLLAKELQPSKLAIAARYEFC